MARIDERTIAKNSEQMLTSALRSKTQRFADHVNQSTDKASLKEAFAKARTKKMGLKKNGSDVYFMRSLSIKMAKHGFIREYGVNKTRVAGIRTRNIPRRTTYSFKDHVMNQPAKPFINSAVESSRVVSYVAEKVSESRADIITNDITITLKQFS